MSSDLFEQVANIAKAHNADIYAKQVQELKECNRELIEALEPFANLSKQIPDSKKGNVFGYNDANLSIEDFRRADIVIKKSAIISL